MAIDFFVSIDGGSHKAIELYRLRSLLATLPDSEDINLPSLPAAPSLASPSVLPTIPCEPESVDPAAGSHPVDQDDDTYLTAQHKRMGHRAVDYAHKAAQKHLMGKRFGIPALVEMMEKEGWPTTSKIKSNKASNVRSVIKNDPAFVKIGKGVWMYEASKIDKGKGKSE